MKRVNEGCGFQLAGTPSPVAGEQKKKKKKKKRKITYEEDRFSDLANRVTFNLLLAQLSIVFYTKKGVYLAKWLWCSNKDNMYA